MNTLLRALLIGTLLGALGSAVLAQVPSFTVRLVGDGTASAVNSQGQVAGNDGNRAWFADVSGGPMLLPLPEDASSSLATDMNDAGWVVGRASGGSFGSKAVIWKPTGPGTWSITIVPTPTDALATAVNDLGDVVGWFVAGGSFAYSETDGFVQLFPQGLTAQPADINNERVLVGRGFFGNGESMDLDTLVVEDLGLPTGTGTNYMAVDLNGINEAGDICGRGVVATAQPDDDQAVRYDAATDTWAALNIPYPQAYAVDLDDAGNTLFAVGFSSPVYVRFEGVGTFDLETLLVPEDQAWSVGLASGGHISDNGIVVCTGGNAKTSESGVLVLTPAPEPGWLDMGGALAGTAGTPALVGSGDLTAGSVVSFALTSALPGGTTNLVFGLSELSAPFKGGTLVPAPDLILFGLPLDWTGALELPATWPAGLPAGLTTWWQHWIADPAGPFGWAASNGLAATQP